jgi:hypothetical protein
MVSIFLMGVGKTKTLKGTNFQHKTSKNTPPKFNNASKALISP